MRLASAVLAVLAPLPAAAAPLAFEGRWDCEVGEFLFTAELYDPGDGEMQILDIAQEGDIFTLTFEADYQLSLAMNPDGTMTWFSPVSGDEFLCHPLP